MDCFEVIDVPFMLVELLCAHLANPSGALSFELTLVKPLSEHIILQFELRNSLSRIALVLLTLVF